MMHVMSCDDVQSQLEEFHDDELSIEQRVAVQGHLRDCVTCALAAAELEELRDSLREATLYVPGRGAPGVEQLSEQVVERLRVEESLSFSSEMRARFQDMHLVWAALGATAATVICLIGALSVLYAANQQRPDSLAGLIAFLANPGSNENPMRLDTRMLAPRSRPDLDAFMPLPPMPVGDAVLTLSAVVTREGRVRNLELLDQERALGMKVRPDVLLAMLAAASQVEFEPAKGSSGDPVAVSMVWVLANTTVKGHPIDDIMLVRRPVSERGDVGPAAPRPEPAAPVTRPTGGDEGGGDGAVSY
jgi:hypothetical protein